MKNRQSKLQTKLFKAYLSLACLILFSFAVFFYCFVSNNLIKSQIQAMNTLNSSFYNQVENSLRSLDTVSVNINYSNISKNILNSSFDLDITSDMLSETSDLFISLSGTELKADQVNLYDFSGHVLQSGLSTNVKETDPSQSEMIEQAVSLEGSKILTLPYETDAYSRPTKYKRWFLSLYRSFNNQYGRPVGAIETVKQCKSIFKSIITYEKRNKEKAALVYIFDQNGNIVYPYAITEEQRKNIEPYFFLSTRNEAEYDQPFKSPNTGFKEYAAVEKSKYSGYTYMTIQPENVILEPVHSLLLVLFTAVFIFLFLSVLFSYNISKSIVRPIKHLKHIIQRIEIDTLGEEKATAYPVSVNELEELYQAFQNMSDNLKDSMEKLIEAQEQEIKSRTLALQTQINPHFYYNSLSSLIILAENQDTDVLIKTCHNLSNIMRYITNTTNSIVTLREEIDYVQKYLYCMKVRYQSSLNYSISIDDCLLDKKVPKLIIQPIVENAIKYGSDCPPPWNIRIQSHITDSSWKIDIIDSGNGFSKEAIEKITQNIKKAQENPGMPELKINGLGTLNVYLRWKLYCKKDIIFTYGNTKDGHGIVSIGQYETLD